MTSEKNDRYWKTPSVWLAVAASAAILLLGVRAFLDPVAASVGFGLPMKTVTETSFVQVYGSRNAMLGAIALAFTLSRTLRSAACIYTFALALPLLDIWVLISRIGVGPELIRHAAIFVIVSLVAFLLWRESGRFSTGVQPS